MDSDESSSGTPPGSLGRQIIESGKVVGQSGGPSGVSGQDEEEDLTFKMESILFLGTFTVEENEKVIPTMETGAFANLVDVFSKDPYIHATQTSRFNSNALEALWTAIQLGLIIRL